MRRLKDAYAYFQHVPNAGNASKIAIGRFCPSPSLCVSKQPSLHHFRGDPDTCDATVANNTAAGICSSCSGTCSHEHSESCPWGRHQQWRQ